MGISDSSGLLRTAKGFKRTFQAVIPDPNVPGGQTTIGVYLDDLRFKVWSKNPDNFQNFVAAWQQLLSSFDAQTRAAIYQQSVIDPEKPIFEPGYFNPEIMEEPMASLSLIKTTAPKLQTQAPGGMVIAPNPNAPRVPTPSQPGKPPGTLPATATAAGSNMTALYWLAGGVAAFYLAKKARIF